MSVYYKDDRQTSNYFKDYYKFLFLIYLRRYLFSFIYYYHHRERNANVLHNEIIYDV